ncbi:MAG: hypothetical protein APR53_01570 [Methanoculleus sp. SDB]|nr:MAG: hypothetical protein APR53_01570 [Methanoculleus sp. SDB]
MISRAKQNAVVDICALVAFIPSTVSGLVLFLLLPAGGYQGGRNLLYAESVLGVTRSGWIDIHDYSSLIFVVFLILHLLLHWRYFKNLPRIFRVRETDRCETDR